MEAWNGHFADAIQFSSGMDIVLKLCWSEKDEDEVNEFMEATQPFKNQYSDDASLESMIEEWCPRKAPAFE